MVKNTRKNYFGGSGSGYVANAVGGLQQQISKALGSSSKSNTLTGGARRRRTNKRKGGARTKRRSTQVRRTKTRRRTGGFLGSVISSAVVPFGLWGAQRKLARRIKKKSSKK